MRETVMIHARIKTMKVKMATEEIEETEEANQEKHAGETTILKEVETETKTTKS